MNTQTNMDFKLILYLCISGVVCYPSKPLNDRPAELEWQAWLLVDSPNSNEGDRRITPKSVFIAPNINGGSSLPECAEGYRSDPMGRCIKFVKVDEAAHLDFLLQRLNAMYATRPQNLDDETKPTSGPLQVNIPLGEKEPEIAIIVAPTNGNFDETEVKLNKRKEETTTEPTTTEETTTEDETTTATTTTDSTTTLSEDLQALFFLVPKNNQTEITTSEVDSTPKIHAEFSVKDTAIFERTPEDNSPEFVPEIIPERLVMAPEADRLDRLSSSEIEHLFNEYTRRRPTSSDHSRPPPDASDHSRPPPDASDHSRPRPISSDSTDHVRTRPISFGPSSDHTRWRPTSTEHIRRRPINEESFLEEITTPQIPRPYFNQQFNHRNRDRTDFWNQPQTFHEDSLPVQKPLVLRFKNPYSQEQSSGEQARYYDRPQEFAYGRKRRRGNFR